MVKQELSNLFDYLSGELTPDVLNEVRFLIDDYFGAFGISDNLELQQMLDELHGHLGTRQLIQLLSDVFKVMDRVDLCIWIWSYASKIPSEDVVALEESEQRISGDINTAMETSSASSPLMSDLREQPSIQPDADNSEGISLNDSSRSMLHGGLQPEDNSLDSLDTSGNYAERDDAVGSLTPLIQSPQHSSGGQQNSPGDSGFSSESASSKASRSESSGAGSNAELETPIQLNNEEMKGYIDDTQQIGEGGFGNVYKGKYEKRVVAIKTGRLIKSNERQFLKEKQLAFLRHTFIVPILAYSIEKHEMMIMYPYMDNGDLTKVHHTLDWKNSLRVFYQISEGLAFLQRPVQGVRYEIIHGDIKPANILLDANLNARLGDVGLAAEVPPGATHYTATANVHYGSEGYVDPFLDEDNERVVRRKENDVFSLGIVGLQLLKWQPAVQSVKRSTGAKARLLLWDKLEKEIDYPFDAQKLISSQSFFDKNIWNQDEKDSFVNQMVVELIIACLGQIKERISAEGLASKLKELLVANNIPRYIFMEGKLCQFCCINEAGPCSTLTLCSDTYPENCKFMLLCRTCHNTAYRNPLFCPEHGRLKQFIRPEECFAILITGFDAVEEIQKTFDDDILAMLNVICNPRVMGFSQDNVTIINKNTMEKRKKIRNSIQKLQERSVEMLILYYSGHGTDEKSGVAELNVSKGDTDNMKAEELKECLDSVKCTRLLVILDCCFAARYEVVSAKPRGASDSRLGWRIQLNAAGALKDADITDDNKSVFTRHLIHAIKVPYTCPLDEGETDKNAPPCRLCTKFKTLSEARGHIDIYDVVGFCSEHIRLEAKRDEEENQESSMIAGELTGSAPLIPYTTSKPFDHMFHFQNKEESEKFHLKDLKLEPDQILQQLWDKINACCSLPKHTSYRCLKMQGLVRAKEEEIRTRDELILQFNRGHVVQVCIRSAGSDLDSERHVVVFCSQHDKFTDILENLETVYKLWFQIEEPRKDRDLEAEYSCIIKCGETDEITNAWKFSSHDDERKNFSDVVTDSVSRANTLSREHMRTGKPPISGLRIDVTAEFALLSLV